MCLFCDSLIRSYNWITRLDCGLSLLLLLFYLWIESKTKQSKLQSKIPLNVCCLWCCELNVVRMYFVWFDCHHFNCHFGYFYILSSNFISHLFNVVISFFCTNLFSLFFFSIFLMLLMLLMFSFSPYFFSNQTNNNNSYFTSNNLQ